MGSTWVFAIHTFKEDRGVVGTICQKAESGKAAMPGALIWPCTVAFHPQYDDSKREWGFIQSGRIPARYRISPHARNQESLVNCFPLAGVLMFAS
jgi:hypothetical protein